MSSRSSTARMAQIVNNMVDEGLYTSAHSVDEVVKQRDALYRVLCKVAREGYDTKRRVREEVALLLIRMEAELS